MSSECAYVKLKKTYSHELTIHEFIEIEKFRLLRKNVGNIEFLFKFVLFNSTRLKANLL